MTKELDMPCISVRSPSSSVRDIKEARWATERNKQQHFNVKNKPQTMDYTLIRIAYLEDISWLKVCERTACIIDCMLKSTLSNIRNYTFLPGEGQLRSTQRHEKIKFGLPCVQDDINMFGRLIALRARAWRDGSRDKALARGCTQDWRQKIKTVP